MISTLALPNNNLNGDIPEEIGQLTSLEVLDLSGNALAGPLPTSVALLQNTTNSCDLSKNDVSLCIPENPDIASITSETICGLPAAFSCSAVRSPGVFSSVENRKNGTVNEIVWSAIRRIPDAHFEVEKKENGTYIVIGRVDTPNHLDQPQQFSYLLPELENGIHTFRIHMTTTAGASLYSEELNVISASGSYLMEPPFPNPTLNTSTVQFIIEEAQPIKLTLFDTTGRQIQVVFDGNPELGVVQQVDIEATSLASGVYFLRLEGNAFIATQTLVVQK